MTALDEKKIAYVVKRYPRFSETFIVNEILAHEEAGVNLEIFTLRPCCDAHFQDRISRVRADVNYLPAESPKASALWKAIRQGRDELPDFDKKFFDHLETNVQETYQGLHLALAAHARDIAHFHAHFATSAAEVTRIAADLAGISYSLTAHAKDIFHEDVQQADLERKFSQAHTVITVSDFNEQFLRDQFPGSANRIVRLFNGIDLDQFTFQSPQSRERNIVAVGRLVEKKGFSDLIAACAVLKEQGNSFQCQIIGDGELHAQLQQQIDQAELGDLVELTGGLPQSEVIRRVQQAAVVAAPCVVGGDGNRDGMPTILLEAMALGTPCVATDVTGIPEIIENEQTGLLTRQGDAQQLAGALKRLLDEPQTRVQIAHAARARVERDFDIRTNAEFQREIFAAAMAHETASASQLQGAI